MRSFIVKASQTKRGETGIKDRARYMFNMNHPSHQTTTPTEIRSFLKANYYIQRNLDERQAERKEKGLRGGSVKNHATEYSLNLPEGYHLNDDQWKRLAQQTIQAVAQRNELDPNQLWAVTGAVVHRETGDKKDHMHIMFGNVIGKDHIKGLTQFKSKKAAELTFNRFLLKELGLDIKTFKPKNPGRKGVPLWKARQQKEQQKKKEAESLHNSTKELCQQTEKYLKQYQRQAEKLEQALKENDQKQINRQRNRMRRSQEALEEAQKYSQAASKRIQRQEPPKPRPPGL